jgi:broad specificity phosphatase PhoE
MAHLLLVRHGETDWNVTGRIMGRQPVPLNSTGEQQAHALSQELRRLAIDAIYVSPTLRTQQTGQIIASTCRASIEVEDGLVEIGVGDWEGRYWKELTEDPIRHRYYSHTASACPPGGETLNEVQRRAATAVERRSSHRNGTLLFVSHADVIRTILAHYFQLEMHRVRHMRIDHASVTAIHLGVDHPELLYLNRIPG